jgi:hypothetical protein
MVQQPDPDHPQGKRGGSHSSGAENRIPLIEVVHREVGEWYEIGFRGENQVITFYRDVEHDIRSRIATPGMSVGALGLDMLIIKKEPEKHEVKSRHIQVDIRSPKVLKMSKYFKHLRTTAPRNGTPDEEETVLFYKDQWLMPIHYETMDKEYPYKVSASPTTRMIKAGLMIPKERDGGFFFPNHKGRRNTVHWFTKYGNFIEGRCVSVKINNPTLDVYGRTLKDLLDLMFRKDAEHYFINNSGTEGMNG